MNYLRLKPPSDNTCLDLKYSLYVSSSQSAPKLTSSTYTDLRNFCTKLGWTSLYLSRWCLTVAFRRKGLDDTPKTTQLKWKARTLGVFSWILATYRNRRASLSFGQTEIPFLRLLQGPPGVTRMYNDLLSKLGACV